MQTRVAFDIALKFIQQYFVKVIQFIEQFRQGITALPAEQTMMPGPLDGVRLWLLADQTLGKDVEQNRHLVVEFLPGKTALGCQAKVRLANGSPGVQQ